MSPVATRSPSAFFQLAIPPRVIVGDSDGNGITSCGGYVPLAYVRAHPGARARLHAAHRRAAAASRVVTAPSSPRRVADAIAIDRAHRASRLTVSRPRRAAAAHASSAARRICETPSRFRVASSRRRASVCGRRDREFDEPPHTRVFSRRRARRVAARATTRRAMRDDGPRALVEGLDGAVARAARALDAHARGAADAQDALCARVDRCADALEALVDAMPTSASEAHAKRLRSLRQRIDGLGASARDLRDRARALHDDARASRRADSSALAAREGDELPPRDAVFRDG
jgi:hypothetical protein